MSKCMRCGSDECRTPTLPPDRDEYTMRDNRTHIGTPHCSTPPPDPATSCAEEIRYKINGQLYDNCHLTIESICDKQRHLTDILRKHFGDCESVQYGKYWTDRCKELQAENENLKSHCNTVWQLVSRVLPFCPQKMKEMIEKAAKDGKKLCSEGTRKLKELQEETDKLREYKDRMDGAMEGLLLALPDKGGPVSDDKLVEEAIKYIAELEEVKWMYDDLCK